MKNKNPEISSGANIVEKKTPTGSNRKETLVAMYIIANIISNCIVQYFNLPFTK